MLNSLDVPRELKNVTFVCNCLVAKISIRNDSLTSEECRLENFLQNGDT